MGTARTKAKLPASEYLVIGFFYSDINYVYRNKFWFIALYFPDANILVF